MNRAVSGNCVVDISNNGLRIIVDDQNCVQGIAYFKIDLFTEFVLNEDECLTAFGTGVSTVVKMTYDGYGEPLKLMLEKDGIVARCLIKTQDPDIVLDFDFNPASVTAKIIMKPWMLKETFHELDQSSPAVGFRIDRFSLNVITEGDLGKIKTKFPHYSEQIERLECKQNVEFTYRLNLIKRMTPSLDICSKLSLRIDQRGILSIQFMVEHNENSHVFLEFFCIPDTPILEK
ncbi:Cell cycle checkpoint protein RAD1 [Dirofilaria immitis]|nr:Cell cycle checkpoint protein RAD1 [Dirofilaria immitis]